MLMELARGPLIFKVITIGTALTEEHFDLDIGSRGFRLQVRPTSGVSSAVLRVSNIKGEVSKTVGDPQPKFWTVPLDTHFEGFLGLRVMAEDAPPDEDGDAVQVKAGEVREQRWYVTSETANTVIEIVEVPGS